jgi:quinoprotein glucose dehydrogenase
VSAPANQYTMESYGLYPTLINPPFTTLTAYDLNKGTIKWQIGVGDDLRVTDPNVKGTGAAEFLKGSVITTSTGLVFVNAADRKIHVYDSDTGKQIAALNVGATTSGSPSMYELNGQQYLLVTASPTGTRIGNEGAAADPKQTGPTGLIAYALKK